jgi:hypothetical protein
LTHIGESWSIRFVETEELQMATRTQNALAELNRRIENGEEFPDIAFAIASKWGVKYATLTRAYDAQWD